ncbi:MAG: peptidoglycan-binding domain-containing protein [Candidatus Omnitrophica bacterium]|nr:peptidoglycan-binding domain-containing protein [Candidatus Omnitrophota bacterium]MDD5355680.1 peptidoglycan-binding domain-containing protein [Candidatus Omnitrophota bacterium]
MDKIRYNLGLGIALFLIIFISGCVSLPQNQKNSELEDRLAKIEERIAGIEKGEEAPQGKSVVKDKKYSAQKIAGKVEPVREMVRFPSNEDIQIALKNAGLYDGKIDGQIGTKTRNAIKEFQKQNDLEIDGVVGRNTWDALGKFYYMPLEEVIEREAQPEKIEEAVEEAVEEAEEELPAQPEVKK